MPLYFFHLRGEGLLLEDCEGTDLPNLHAAWEEVARAKRELVADGTDVCGLWFEIATREGRVLLKVHVGEGHRAA